MATIKAAATKKAAAKKAGKPESEDSEVSENQKVFNQLNAILSDPLKMLYVKPLGTLSETITC